MPFMGDHSASKPRNKLRKLSKPRPGSVISTASPRESAETPPRLSLDGHMHGARASPPMSTQQQLQQPQPQQRQPQQVQQQQLNQQRAQAQAQAQARLHPPPDLSSPKWEDYVTNSGFPRPMEKSPRLGCDRSRSPCKPIPELAHLATTSTTSTTTTTIPRAPTSTNSSTKNHSTSPAPASPSPSVQEIPLSPRTSTSSSRSRESIRKYAKTPVFRVGQLEAWDDHPVDSSSSGPPSLLPPFLSPSSLSAETTARRASGASEVMAEQYRALLAPQTQTYEQFSSDLVREWEERQNEEEMETRQHSIETIRSAITRRSPLPRGAGAEAEADNKSSPSSDTTLVDFEEDAAIYFKPAFTPETLTPIPEHQALSAAATTASGSSSFYELTGSGNSSNGNIHGFGSGTGNGNGNGNVDNGLGLQMSVDLLTRELALAIGRGSPAAGGDGSMYGGREIAAIGDDGDESRGRDSARNPLLQILVMTEAYKRLRSQVRGMDMADKQRDMMEDMFGTWLEALQRVGQDIAQPQPPRERQEYGYNNNNNNKTGHAHGNGRVDMVQGSRIA
ncbi:hypothetical protein BD289DRAFT_434328 [Coniella lustricola]|uniref:Uncharacterized protein n=1 Tax=Coniella lustricola TaxID=2025994 RepID=A0A2T3A7K7_9PEZI|nr:hypothetical protein BD289DRAFT_434328 [Coniella lustricola]